MPEAGPVETHHTIAARQDIDEPADDEILDHRAVAVEQHDAGSRGIATIDVVEAHAIALDKGADRWVPPFRDPREHDIADHQDNQNDDDNKDNGFSGGHS